METRFRTEIESLFLAEMVEEDTNIIVRESGYDEIILANNESLFGDDTSSDDDIFDDEFEYEDDLNIF